MDEHHAEELMQALVVCSAIAEAYGWASVLIGLDYAREQLAELIVEQS